METIDKLKEVQRSPEILSSVQLLIAAFHDCELQSHIRFTYQTNDGQYYEMTFMPVGAPIHNSLTTDEHGKRD